MTERAAFRLDPADGLLFRESMRKLAAIGYGESRVRERLGLEDLSDLHWRLLPIYRAEHLANRDPLAMAIDLFLLQGAVTTDELSRLFTPSERDVLIRAGLVAVVNNEDKDDDEDDSSNNDDSRNNNDDDKNLDRNEKRTGIARARASLFPVGDRLIFSDHAWPELPHPGYDTVPCDHVMAIGPDSRKLARCTTRRPFQTALDLCTGSGIQALLASAHSGHVLAIDINPRAARCVRFNAEASCTSNLEVVVGDLFGPVRGERFDLITANPPFVPSPFDTVRFRDGGRTGEDVQRRIVAGLPHHLAPGGIAQLVTELGERKGEPLGQRLREWLNGAPMDIHILRLGEHAAMKYALAHAKGDTYAAFLDSTEEWASNLRAQRYDRVVSLLISFQWSDATCGPPWVRVDESPPPQRLASTEIDAAFLAERCARRLDWQPFLEHSRLRRAGPIAILDAQVFGGDLRSELRSELRAKTRATLLGRALKIEHQIDAVERDILCHMDVDGDGVGRISVPDLIEMFRGRNVNETSVFEAVRSLLRRQLVRIDSDGCLGESAASGRALHDFSCAR
jgi:methyltransferase family protein